MIKSQLKSAWNEGSNLSLPIKAESAKTFHCLALKAFHIFVHSSLSHLVSSYSEFWVLYLTG